MSLQRAQLLDLPAKPDELRAIDLRLLEFAQKLFVGLLDCGLAHVPSRFRLSNRMIGLGKSLAELIVERLQFSSKRFKDFLDPGKDVGVRQSFKGLA